MAIEMRALSDTPRYKILCVDDETQVLEGLSLQLGRRYEVLTALSGAEALQILQREERISVLISDMRMPRMDGATFLARARTIAPNAGRILLTGQTDLRSAIAAVNEAQVLKFLSKPCPPPELHAAVETAIERFDQLATEKALSDEVATALRAAQRARLLHLEWKDDGADSRCEFAEIHDEIEVQLIEAERKLINDLYRGGKLKDEARRRIERELDLREARLASLRDEE